MSPCGFILLCYNLTGGLALPPPEYSLHAKISIAANTANLPSELAHAIAAQSTYDPTIVGPQGQIGLFQIQCSPTRVLSFMGPCEQLHDPAVNVFYGLRALQIEYKACGGDRACTITRYHRNWQVKRVNTAKSKHPTKHPKRNR